MTELLIILVSIVVIYSCWYWMTRINTTKSQLKTFTDPVTIKVETPVTNNKPKFSPPVYELEQWIRDNWKKIKVSPNLEGHEDGSQVSSWIVESDVYTGQIVNAGFRFGSYNRYVASGSGLDFDEVTYLKCVYEDILRKREFKLRQIKDQRSRKQLARKLQQLGYGDGRYANTPN